MMVNVGVVTNKQGRHRNIRMWSGRGSIAGSIACMMAFLFINKFRGWCKIRYQSSWFLGSFTKIMEVDVAKHLGIIVLSVNSLHAYLATALTTSFRSCYYGLATLCARFTTLNPCTSLFF